MHGRNHKGEFSCDRGLPFSRLYTRSSKCGIGRSLHCRALPAFVVDGIVTGEQDLRNRYDLIPLGEQVVEDIRQRLGRMLARIVEQHDRPALHLARHTLRDLTRRDALPVEGIPTGSTWKRLSCLASWPPLTVFFPPIHSPPLNMPRINSILVKCARHTAGTAAAELRQQFCEIQSAFAQISQTGAYHFLIDRDHIRRHADHGTGSNLRFQMRYSSRDAVSIWFFLNRIQHAEILCGILCRRVFLISIGETTPS